MGYSQLQSPSQEDQLATLHKWDTTGEISGSEGEAEGLLNHKYWEGWL